MTENIKIENLINLKCERIVYALCFDVFQNKAFSSIILDKKFKSENLTAQEKGYITSFFYGVLDYSIQFDYIIKKLISKPPKPTAVILLKMGLYLLRYSSTPSYAAVNKIVELSKVIGKGGISGFINAVLKKSSNIKLPEISDENSLSIATSTPLWLVKILITDYGFEFVKNLLTYKSNNFTHIKINALKINKADFEEKYPELLKNTTKYGYYVTHSTVEKLSKCDFIIQSYSSIAAINYFYDNYDNKASQILDLCSAPGGKAVLMKELCYNNGVQSQVFACDIHPHRIELIKKYASNAGRDLIVLLNDATVLRDEWRGKFDLVLCDVPCSGMGLIESKPEIQLLKQETDIEELAKIQKQILNTAKNYVKLSGYLCYSTCTILKRENDTVVDEFLKENDNFILEKNGSERYMRLFPHIDNCDGFFAAKMKRII